MSEIREVRSDKPFKQSWPLWKKLAVAGAALLVVIALAVGLGVGLSRRGGDSDNGNDDDDTPGKGKPNNTGIWQPEAGDSWQIILLKPVKLTDEGALSPDVQVWDLDLYDNDEETFKTMQAQGKKIICYFSAGSWENWRDDKDDFVKSDLGAVMDGWPDERWLNVRSDNVRKIMKKRIAYAASKGCDAIDPDNVDGFQNVNGVNLTKKDAVDFVKFLSDTAASYNMSTGLKNAADLISDVMDYVHFSVNEQCVQYSECETFSPFIKAGKPVFHIEYPGGDSNKVATSDVMTICSQSKNSTGAEGFSTVIKKMNLDGWVQYCNQTKTFSTSLDLS